MDECPKCWKLNQQVIKAMDMLDAKDKRINDLKDARHICTQCNRKMTLKQNETKVDQGDSWAIVSQMWICDFCIEFDAAGINLELVQ